MVISQEMRSLVCTWRRRRRKPAGSMRVVFCGTSSFAVPALERLVTAGHDVVQCVAQPDRPRGRGLTLEPSPVKQAALRLRVPLMQPERLRAADLRSFPTDVGVVVAYGQLIRCDVLQLPTHGMLGIHPSLLPAYRGAAPIAWALLQGESVTGVTIFRLVERMDAGEILSQQTVSIAPGEDAEQLSKRLSRLGADAVVEAIAMLGEGRAAFRPQDESQVTLAPKLTKRQGHVDWSASADTIVRLVKAIVPWPGATTWWQGTPLKVWRADVAALEETPGAAPGTIVGIDHEAIRVAAGRGIVSLQEVQPAGRRRMSTKQFLAGHPMQPGDHFDKGSSVISDQ